MPGSISSPEGAQRRFNERYEVRSFRLYALDNGATRPSWILDDETALFIASIQDAALRPRRGAATMRRLRRACASRRAVS